MACPPRGIIAVVAVVNCSVAADFLAAAYRASRHGPIVLLLDGSGRDVIDRELDPIVADVGLL